MEDEPIFVAPLEYTFDGLLIRPYKPGDGAALSEATISSYEHLRPTMEWARDHFPVEEAELVARRILSRYLIHEDFTLSLWDGDRLLGGSGFHLRHGPISYGNAEIGMWVRADASGAGLGTRFLAAMLDWGFGEWGWQRLVWRCNTNNTASARVAQKCGMKLEGTNKSAAPNIQGGDRHDIYLYAAVREEWLSRRR